MLCGQSTIQNEHVNEYNEYCQIAFRILMTDLVAALEGFWIKLIYT
jgi:hypothetical protein